ncbi:MAG: hypothetical protein K8T25_21485 [Planctomycetia bacterium]|nr:hypothetical protein [Planctomycetia bacterium]
MRRWVWCFVAVLVTVVGVEFSTRTALADPPEGNSGERARELFERAARAAAEGRYEEARHFADEARELFAADHEGPAGDRPRGDRYAERPAGPQNDDDQGPPDGPPKRPGPPDADGHRGPDGPPGLDPEKRKQFQEQYQKLREMHRKIRELEQAGKTDEAKKLGEELQEARKKLQEQFPRPQRGGRDGGGRDGAGPGDAAAVGQMPEMYRKMMDLRKQIHDAEEAGDQKKADDLRNQAKEMMRKAMEERMRGIRGEGQPAGPEGDTAGGPPETRRPEGPRPGGRQRGFMPPDRMGRLRMAASLLEQAGFPEDAKHVRDLAKQLPTDEPSPGDGPPKGPPEGHHGPGDHPGEGRPAGPPQPRPEELKARMEKLQEQIRRLSEEVEKSQAKPDGK